jgi:hypothetical protein
MKPYCNALVRYYPAGRSMEFDESGCRRRLGHRGPHHALVEWDV